MAGEVRRSGRHGGRPLRPLRRRRRLGHLLRDLHGLQRIPHQPATPRDHRLPVVHLHADRRARRGQQGLALFPRRIRGRYAAMSRSDRETNSIAYSDHLSVWTNAAPSSSRPSLGGAPTRQLRPAHRNRAGWLVLTHGVGPMRTYWIGAMLLDLDDPPDPRPAPQPLLSPAPRAGRLRAQRRLLLRRTRAHRHLVMPYGIADAAIGIATVPLPELLAALDAEHQDGRTTTRDRDLNTRSRRANPCPRMPRLRAHVDTQR